jgi:hypothetical protein
MINYHNYTSQGTVLVPWGFTKDAAPNDEGLYAVAHRYTSFNGYEAQNALYAVSGNTRDWAYGELGIPAYVIEIKGNTFQTPCNEMPRILDEHLPAMREMLALSEQPYERAEGPRLLRMEHLKQVEQGDALDVSAFVGEAAGPRIDAVELSVGQEGGTKDVWLYPAPDAPPGVALPMGPSDGTFDGPIETALLRLDTSQMPPGRYYLVARARAFQGAWGTALAGGFLDVLPPRYTVTPSATATLTATGTPSSTATATNTATPSPTPRGRKLWLPWSWQRR